MTRRLALVLTTFIPALALAQGTPPPPAGPDVPPAQAPAPKPYPAPAVTEQSKLTTTTQPVVAPPTGSSWLDKLKFSGRAYLRYSYEMNEGANGANQFAIDRLYIQSEYLATDRLRLQATLDAGDTRNSAANNNVVLAQAKYVFVEYKDWVPGLWLRFGILPLAWLPYEEDLWGYRSQGQMAIERFGYVTSADLGLAVGGNFPAKYGSFQVNLNNGEGYKFADLGKRKEVQGRVTLNPLAGLGGLAGSLFVTGYGSYGQYDDAGLTDRTKVRLIGQLGLQSAFVTVAADYFATIDPNAVVKPRSTVGTADPVHGSGYSAFGVLNFGLFSQSLDGLELVLRYDYGRPDVDLPDNQSTLLIAGVAYKFNKYFKALFNYEANQYGPDVGGPGANKPVANRLKLNTEFRL